MRTDYPSQADKIRAEIIVKIMDAARRPSAFDADNVYRDLCANFDAVITLYDVERFSVDAARDLLYPLAALADEALMAIPQYRTRWISTPLQLRYFGEVTAGSGFFSRLKKLTDAPEGNERLLELYFVCLALGFKGMYGTGGQNELRTIFENLGKMLTEMRSSGRGLPAPPHRGGARKKIMTPRVRLFAAFSLLMTAAAIVYLLSITDFLNFLEKLL